jgi:hypothetical protein
MRELVGLTAGFALLSLPLLSGCGSPTGNPLDLPTMASTAPSPTQLTAAGTRPTGDSPSTGPSTDLPGATAELGRLTGSARSHRALAEAAVAYMAVRVAIGNTWTVDQAALDKVATGRAAREAAGRAKQLRSGDRHVVGRIVVNASKASVSGDKATVSGCMIDNTSEVDQTGQVVIDPPGGRFVTLALRRDDGRWRVSDVPHSVPPFCSARST